MIKFQCCHCDQPIEAPEELLHTEIDCPGCLKKVKVLPMQQPTEPADRPSVQITELSESEQIRRTASVLSGIATFLSALGAGFALFAISKSVSGEDASLGFICAGSLIGSALWFYLISQIVHIRALLAKRK